MLRFVRYAVFIALVSLFASSQAWAHAHLKVAEPADKASVSSPTALTLNFSEGLNLPFSGVNLIGPDQHEVKLGEAALKDGGKTLMATVPQALPAGAYTVQWHALSVDGHKTSGSYGFVVAP